jgi:hypothetical protein
VILSDLKIYLRDNGRASLPAMARHFEADAEVLRGMLDVWVRKGTVRVSPPDGHCDGCTACHTRCDEIYEWAAAPTAPGAAGHG